MPAAVYLLNPDTVTHPGATRRLYDTLLSRSQVGVVGARLTFADGSFQHSAFRFPGLRQLWAELMPTPGRLIESAFNGRYPRALYRGEQAFDVDFTLGATMMLKREVIQQTGVFDEAFFIYCEEVDWAWRIKKRGWRILCAPAAHVTHIGGGAPRRPPPAVSSICGKVGYTCMINIIRRGKADWRAGWSYWASGENCVNRAPRMPRCAPPARQSSRWQTHDAPDSHRAHP